MNLRTFTLIVLLALASGCMNNGSRVPVYSAGESRTAGGTDRYVVQKGDTMYSIAFRYGMDYRELAAANNIHPPFTIYVGQHISIDGNRKELVATEQPVAVRSQRKPSTVESGPAGTPPASIQSAPRVADSMIDWRWPYDGEVVAKFASGSVNKGIDIRGKSGAAVLSTADGVVVYAGGGLRGYGKLVIVKHNDRYLSAYGHNKSILVKEGDRVKAGQAVARIGGDKDVLHFEIRRNGKPEDPLRYLPPRS